MRVRPATCFTVHPTQFCIPSLLIGKSVWEAAVTCSDGNTFQQVYCIIADDALVFGIWMIVSPHCLRCWGF